jgi:hypothetical protein
MPRCKLHPHHQMFSTFPSPLPLCWPEVICLLFHIWGFISRANHGIRTILRFNIQFHQSSVGLWPLFYTLLVFSLSERHRASGSGVRGVRIIYISLHSRGPKWAAALYSSCYIPSVRRISTDRMIVKTWRRRTSST